MSVRIREMPRFAVSSAPLAFRRRGLTLEGMPFAFEHSYAHLPERFYARVEPSPVAAPRLLAWNEPLAALLGLTRDDLAALDLEQALAGNRIPEGAQPLALAYAGHQFGGFVPQLGDGRAILLGEVVGRDGVRRDVQL